MSATAGRLKMPMTVCFDLSCQHVHLDMPLLQSVEGNRQRVDDICVCLGLHSDVFEQFENGQIAPISHSARGLREAFFANK